VLEPIGQALSAIASDPVRAPALDTPVKAAAPEPLVAASSETARPEAVPEMRAEPKSQPAGGEVERVSRSGSVETYWELREAPFDNSPNLRFFSLAPSFREALTRLEYAVRHHKGCAMLTGEYGCGKTMLVRALLQRLGEEQYEIGVLANPCRDAVELLREILYQLGVDTEERDKPALLHMLNDLLYRNYRAGRHTVIVIDEAQLIDDARIFEELRLLMNIQTDARFLATVVLVGSPGLRARLARLEHVEQRIGIRCHLETLDLARTASYIAYRLKVAGLTQAIFTDEAIQLIFELTGGAPRRINNLCDIALLAGYQRFAVEIDRKIVVESAKSWRPAPEDEAGEASSADGPLAPPHLWPHRYL
jgi:general secretion pathway protein A